MLRIPDSLNLQRNTRDEQSLLEASRTWLEKDSRASGIHASDLLDLRQAFYRHTDPRDLSDREVTLFLVGRVLHSFVLATGAGQAPDLGISDEGSRYSDSLGLWYSVDWDKGDIAEFKTSRRLTAPKTTADVDTYLEQILVYMAAKQVLTAKLWILFINLRTGDDRKTTPAFRCYTISITPDDLVSVTTMVSEQRQLLANAIETRDPSTLPLCRPWKCGEDNCAWWSACRPPGRYNQPAKEWSV